MTRCVSAEARLTVPGLDPGRPRRFTAAARPRQALAVNYRHAFHAGNFADVMKHALLVRILLHLRKKPAPFRVVDTHAGIGWYDSAGPEALRTGEWRDGIGRLAAPFGPDVEALLAPYREVVERVRTRRGVDAYPGSPAIARELLRRDDRAIFVEKHPADAALLAERFGAGPATKVLALDGWTALGSLLPPKERRGLVLIDPPFEEPGELARSVGRLARAVRRWPTGIFAFWYPIKDEAAADAFASELGAAVAAETLRLELLVDRPDDPARPDDPSRLNGSGLLVVNPPWRLAQDADLLLPALAERLSRRGWGGYRCEPARAGGRLAAADKDSRP